LLHASRGRRLTRRASWHARRHITR
jgi:hypothetical protein